MTGQALETLVFQELQAQNTLLNLGYTLYYWRTSNNIEVDFVLYGPKGLHAFEVKRTGKVKPEMLKGLKAFQQDYPIANTYFVYGGKRRMQQDGVDILPVDVVLKTLPELLS